MASPRRHSLLINLPFLALLGFGTLPVLGIDGGNSLFATTPIGQATGWKSFEILTGNDSLGAIAREGFTWSSTTHAEWDGLGAYRHDAHTLRVFLDHEVGGGGSISRIDLDPATLRTWIANGIPNNTATNQLLPSGPIVQAVSQAWTSIAAGSLPINSPCSGNFWAADTFGPGLGFADPLYLAAEEVSTIGKFRILDPVTRILHTATDLGSGRWENAVPLKTGRPDTIALVLSEDFKAGTNRLSPMRLYVGSKTTGGNFLARNGFVGGSIYYWDPDGTTSTDGTPGGLFSSGNGATATGTWVSSRTTAALFANCEDLHPNMNPNEPGFGLQTVQACEGTGIYQVDFSQLSFISGDLGANRSSTITLLYKSGTQASSEVFSEMDNLVWAADGMVYVCEDSPTGDIWKVDPASLLASYALGDFTPDSSQVSQIFAANPNAESSGIIEISAALNYQPGSLFLVNGKSSSLATNQLALLVSPTAVPLPESFPNWASSFPGLIGQPADDPDQDGISNLLEYAFRLNPTLSDRINLTPETGIKGLPVITLDPLGNTVNFEFLRRIGSSDLIFTPQLSPDMNPDSWLTATFTEVIPIDDSFERVLVSRPLENSAPLYFRVKIELAR